MELTQHYRILLGIPHTSLPKVFTFHCEGDLRACLEEELCDHPEYLEDMSTSELLSLSFEDYHSYHLYTVEEAFQVYLNGGIQGHQGVEATRMLKWALGDCGMGEGTYDLP